MHPNNLHSDSYDFDVLTESNPELSKFVFVNPYGNKSIDFANPEAVFQLNRALLNYYYQVKNWSIPENYLCPPIPGRADYIHHLADLLAEDQSLKNIKGIDIGVGANAIYPILASRIYKWKMLGTDIEENSIKVAKANIKANPELSSILRSGFRKTVAVFLKG